MRRIKIVATIGPGTESYETLKKLAQTGVNVFRLNFSHGSHQSHRQIIERIKCLNQELGTHHAIMLDTKGPEIRTGDIKVPRILKKGETLILTIDHEGYEKKGKVSVNYDAFINDVSVGDTILVDNGFMTLKVREKKNTDVICEILDGGELGSRRHLNLPGKDISLDSITEKDWEDIRFGVKEGVDFIALSFIRTPKEIRTIKTFLEKQKSNIQIIAKVETLEATKHLGGIFEAADGIMVARGDLGAEIPFTQVPLLQWKMAQLAGKYKKVSIVATQMLESMSSRPIPTRAEVADVFTSTWQRHDGIMLSGETANGQYPIKSVQTMNDIAIETEHAYLQKRSIRAIQADDERTELCKNAGIACEDLKEVESIVVFTRSGKTAHMMSAFRPCSPIFVLSEDPQICRQCELLWGTKVFQTKFYNDPEKTIKQAVSVILNSRPELKGTKFVLLSDILINKVMKPSLQIRTF
jgi:pyruvate kinase